MLLPLKMEEGNHDSWDVVASRRCKRQGNGLFPSNLQKKHIPASTSILTWHWVFNKWKTRPSTRQRLQLTLLLYSLYYSDLEPNLQYLQGFKAHVAYSQQMLEISSNFWKSTSSLHTSSPTGSQPLFQKLHWSGWNPSAIHEDVWHSQIKKQRVEMKNGKKNGLLTSLT